MRKHDKNKTRMLEYIYTVTFILIYQIYIIIILYQIFYVVILFYISKTSIDRKINKQQKWNSMGKILIYLEYKDVLLIKSSKSSKFFYVSFVEYLVNFPIRGYFNVYRIVPEPGQMDLFIVL